MKKKIIEMTFVTTGINSIDPEKFKSITNRPGVSKPFGGLWAAEYTPDGEFVSDWQEYCRGAENDLFYKDGVTFELKDSARIYEIHSQKDLIDLCHTVGGVTMFDALGIPAPAGMYFDIAPNFEELAKQCDGIYISEDGIVSTHMPSSNSEYNLYSWDIPSLLLFNLECIKEVRSLAEISVINEVPAGNDKSSDEPDYEDCNEDAEKEKSRLMSILERARSLPEGNVFIPKTYRWFEMKIGFILSSFGDDEIVEEGFADEYEILLDECLSA